MLRWLTAGESHGPALVAILEGLPAGVEVSRTDLGRALARRRLGFGRGARMAFEQDEVEFLGGVRHGRTLGSPVAIRVGNSEWPKWQTVMSPEAVDPGAYAAANDAKYCNFWLNDGTGDGFSSHLHAAAQSAWVADARMRGMRCVTVEPRFSISAAKSEEWVPIRPATDRQFALSMCHVMVDEGWYDHKMLRKDTNAPYLVGDDGYFIRNAEGKIYVWDAADNRAKLWDDPSVGEAALEGGAWTVEGKPCKPAFQRFRDILADCSPEAMEKLTTVPAATVRRLAKEMYDAAGIAADAKIEIDGRVMPLRPAAYNYYLSLIHI